MSTLPQRFENVEALEEFMSEPTPGLIADLARVDGDIMVLGVGGKMGPTLARMAKRASPGRRVIGVAPFSDPTLQATLTNHGVDSISCDLLDRQVLPGRSDRLARAGGAVVGHDDEHRVLVPGFRRGLAQDRQSRSIVGAGFGCSTADGERHRARSLWQVYNPGLTRCRQAFRPGQRAQPWPIAASHRRHLCRRGNAGA